MVRDNNGLLWIVRRQERFHLVKTLEMNLPGILRPQPTKTSVGPPYALVVIHTLAC